MSIIVTQNGKSLSVASVYFESGPTEVEPDQISAGHFTK